MVSKEVVKKQDEVSVAVDGRQVRFDAAEIILQTDQVEHLPVRDGPRLLLVEEQPPDEEVELFGVQDGLPTVIEHPGESGAVLAKALERHLLLAGGQNVSVDFAPNTKGQVVQVVLETLPAFFFPQIIDGGEMENLRGQSRHDAVLGQGHQARKPLEGVSCVDRANPKRPP